MRKKMDAPGRPDASTLKGMRVGIDFGTTRIVVASADRGNFPLVHFEAPDGQMYDWLPAVAAIKGSERFYGWQAFAKQEEPGWTLVRSIKRYLREAGPHSVLEVEGQRVSLWLVLTEMMAALREQLLEHSNLQMDANERIEAVLGVPANANSNQRFLTEEAARMGGFAVLGLMNEPSAAAVEFAYRNSAERKSRAKGSLLVYDLGGGTFDASLVTLGETEHVIDSSDGMPNVGGDDFDAILAELTLEESGHEGAATAIEKQRLLLECREKKESLNPNTRRITIDLERVRAGWEQVTIPVDAYYERCRPLIEATREMVENLIAMKAEGVLDTLYVTGGGSELPPVARVLRETFGRKVKRSAYMRSASAIGLAIRAELPTDRILDQFNQNFGIWREADAGQKIVFDLIFSRGTELPAEGAAPLHSARSYRPAHNIGHFRYLECSRLDGEGEPAGEISNWDQVFFPFDPRLRDEGVLSGQPIHRLPDGQDVTVREDYTCDASGHIHVSISAEPAGYRREFVIGQQATQGS
jgi:molecular chaperone DnaK (HSP70)